MCVKDVGCDVKRAKGQIVKLKRSWAGKVGLVSDLVEILMLSEWR